MQLPMSLTLTAEQKLALKIQHDTTVDGWISEEIADALLIYESTVRQHINDDSKISSLNTSQNVGHIFTANSIRLFNKELSL